MLPVIYKPKVQELGELEGWKPFKAISRMTHKPRKVISRAIGIKKKKKKTNAARVGGKIKYAVLKKLKQQRKQNKKVSLNKVSKAKILTKPTMTKVSCNLNKLQQIYKNNKKVLEENRKIYQANLQIYNNNKKVVNEFKQLLKKYGLV